ncbi:MAG: hypothetical protein JST92_03850, partial [Deltaproteobacteria bacterium]|nr:hypothetical protein [Deltaproteobacteria bacterium]
SKGDRLFDLVFATGDGLGPVFIRQSCGACHASAARGPGTVQKMIVVEADGTVSADQSALQWGNTVRPFYAGGGTQGLLAPSGTLSGGKKILLSTRAGPAVLGRGYIEAIADSEIEAQEAAQASRDDGIHGRINRVTWRSESNPDTRFHAHFKGETNLIGRFGLKARQATLDDFAADALQGDMGLTSPLRPDELPNPDGLTDDAKAGADVPIENVNALAMYMRLIAMPKRATPPAGGKELFESARCDVCHVESMRTRADYPIAALAGLDAPIYSDLLLHDMGSAAFDGLSDESAHGSEWKTPPLIGLTFQRSYLHDGTATTLSDAVLRHDSPGSQAHDSIARFKALSDADQKTLLAFLATL